MTLENEMTALDFSDYAYSKEYNFEDLISVNAASEDYDLLSLISILPSNHSTGMKNALENQKTDWLSHSSNPIASMETEKIYQWNKSVDKVLATDAICVNSNSFVSFDQCFTGEKQSDLSSQPDVWTEEEQSLFYDIMQNVSVPDVQGVQNEALSESETPSPQSTVLSCFKILHEKLEGKTMEQIGSYYIQLTKHIQLLFEKIKRKLDTSDAAQTLIAVQCWSRLHSRSDNRLPESIVKYSGRQLAHQLLKMIDASHGHIIELDASKSHSGSSSPDSQSNVFSGSLLATSVKSKTQQIDYEQDSYFWRSPKCVEHYPPVRRKRQRSASTKSINAMKKPRQILPQHTNTNTGENRKILRGRLKHGEAFADQNEDSSKQKMAIKIRMIPLDDTTKRTVAKCGLNPKVELKVSSTKRILHVLRHMQKKWDIIQSTYSNLAGSSLCFYPESERHGIEKGAKDIKIDQNSTIGRTWTCLQLWGKWGEADRRDNIIQLLYVWDSCNTSGITQANSSWKQADDFATSKTDVGEAWNPIQDDFRSNQDFGLPSLASLHPGFPSSHTVQAKLPKIAPAEPEIIQSRENTQAKSHIFADLQRDTSRNPKKPPQSHRRRIVPTLVPKQEFDI